jgi:hypothetical protein
MRITTARTALLALTATLALAGCASNPRYATAEFGEERGIGIEVMNHNWMDVVIYAVSSGTKIRLGSVTTGLIQRFRLPRSMNAQSGDFHLEAHMVGSNEVLRSDPILVNPGGRVIWSLENQLALSSYRVTAAR